MKITMNVEDVALMVARPSQISLRLGALLDKNRRRRPVSRATKWLALLLTVAFIPLLAAARAATDSSPEKTVRSFVAALNAAQFEDAVRYVDGKAPNPDFTTLRQSFRRAKPSFSVSMLTSEIKGDTAVVKATLTIRSANQPTDKQVQTGNVAMVRRGTRWLIAPLLGAKNPYITSGAGLECKIFDREFDSSCPVDADVKGGSDISQAGFYARPSSMGEMLEIQNTGEQGKDGFDNHALVPRSFFAHLEIDGITLAGVEAAVAQNDHLVFDVFEQGMKGRIINVGGVAHPVHHLSLSVAQQTQFGTDDPAMIALALFADLLFAAPFSLGVDQLDTKAVAHAEKGGLG